MIRDVRRKEKQKKGRGKREGRRQKRKVLCVTKQQFAFFIDSIPSFLRVFFFFNFPIYFLSKWDPRTLRLLFHAKNPTIIEKVKVPLPSSPTNSIAPDPSTSSMDCLDCYITITRPRSTHFSSLALQSNLLLSTSYLPLSAFCPDKTLLLRQHRSRIMSLMGNIFSIAANLADLFWSFDTTVHSVCFFIKLKKKII